MRRGERKMRFSRGIPPEVRRVKVRAIGTNVDSQIKAGYIGFIFVSS